MINLQQDSVSLSLLIYNSQFLPLWKAFEIRINTVVLQHQNQHDMGGANKIPKSPSTPIHMILSSSLIPLPF